MEVHPLALLTLAYAGNSTRKADKLLAQVLQELKTVTRKDNGRRVSEIHYLKTKATPGWQKN